jgi:hypothetical protein
VKDLGGGRPLCLRKERLTNNCIGGCKSGYRSHLGSKGTENKTLYEIVSMKISKETAEIFKKIIALKITMRIARSTVGLLPS